LLVVLDTCSLSLGAEPSGGITIQVKDIEGLPGTTLLLPVVRESAEQLYEGMGKYLDKMKVFTPSDMRQEVHGTNPERAA
jgi:hypothetical protein